jgi:hypothetical protein
MPFLGNYPHGFCVAASTQPGLILDVQMETTYYWQVRTIDTGFAKSTSWSTMQSTFCVIPPGKVTGLSASIPTDAQMQLTWTAPGDDNYTGNVTGGMWRIAYSSATNATGDTAAFSLYYSSSYFNIRNYLADCEICHGQPA